MNMWCATFDEKIILFLAVSIKDAMEKVNQINLVEQAKKVSLCQNPPANYLDRLN